MASSINNTGSTTQVDSYIGSKKKDDPMAGSKTIQAVGAAIARQVLATSPDAIAGQVGNLNIEAIQIGQNPAAAAEQPAAGEAGNKDGSKGGGLTINYGKPKEPAAADATTPAEGTAPATDTGSATGTGSV